MPQLKANEQLFNQWRFLNSRIASLASIVQNDFPIENDRLKIWEDNASTAEKNLSALIKETLEYVNELKGCYDSHR